MSVIKRVVISAMGTTHAMRETTVGQIADVPVPRTRGGYQTQLFERSHRRRDELDSAIGEMFVKGVSTTKVGQVIETLTGSHRSRLDGFACLPYASWASMSNGSNAGFAWWLLRRRPFFTYRGHTRGVLGVAWSPNSTRIASASLDNTAKVWDAADGGHFFDYNGHVITTAWSPDGTRIALSSFDDTVQIWSPG